MGKLLMSVEGEKRVIWNGAGMQQDDVSPNQHIRFMTGMICSSCIMCNYPGKRTEWLESL